MDRRNLATKIVVFLAVLFMAGSLSSSLVAQTTTFTVQGVMTDGGTPANGIFDFRFRLFDTLTDGNQIGDTLTVPNIQTDGGAWRANLDFGATPFPGADRFLEVSYSRAGEGAFTTLTPRRPITGIPYAIRALKAANADVAIDAQNLGGIAASQFVQTHDSRLSDARVPLPGSNDYIQNGPSSQPSATFNIGGTASANVVNAASQFNLNGNRVLIANSNGLFVGIGSGGPTTSTGNVFVGPGAGMRTTSGGSNTFLGQSTGRENLTGTSNTFLGFAAGIRNTTGSNNTFIGSLAGNFTTTTQVNNSVAIGNNATVSRSNTIVLGTTSQETQVPGRLVVGTPFSTGGPLPGRGYAETFFVTNIFQGIYTPNVLLGSYVNNPRGTVRPCVAFQTIPGLATGVTLTNCVSSFSSVADKTDVKPFTDGLAIIKRLKPVAFKYKENGMSGIGLNTEDVAEVDTSLLVRDSKLSAETVSDNGIIVLLINSIKQQNARIEEQEKRLGRQQQEIEALRTIVCAENSQQKICRAN
jgi:hypothetical protein